MLWHRLLILAATLVALILSVNLCLRSGSLSYLIRLPRYSENSDGWLLQKNFFDRFQLRYSDQAERCYPFVWQKIQRKGLRTLLARSRQAPTGSDELALARYLQYAETHEDEQVFREGVRREPHNALYHYLLADMYLKQSLHGEGPRTDKKTGAFHYDYTITDRRKLDLAMQEVAVGLQMPFQSHRDALLRAQLAAMPPMRNYEDRDNEIVVLTSILHHEYYKIFNIARVNGFYLSLLLSEGKRAEAEPFLHTGEHLVVQMSSDTPTTLVGQLAALAVGKTCKINDARICRLFALTREAAMIEAHQTMLIGKLWEWEQHGRKEHAKEMDALIRERAGVLTAILPVLGTEPKGLITRESLAPSRLVEYVLAERAIVSGLSLFAFLLLLYAGLKYWRWKLAARDTGLPASDIEHTPMDWLRIWYYGLLAPLALYLLYIAVPALSRRDHNIVRAGLPFIIGVGIFTLWTLIVPTTMAAGILWQRSIAAGLVMVEQPWLTRFSRLMTAVLSAIWSMLAIVLLLLSISWALLTPVLAHSPFSDGAQVGMMCIWGALMLAIPLLPAIWIRKHAGDAPHHLAMARAMMTIYAVMTLFFASFVPVCDAFERYYVRTDRLMGLMQQGDDIYFTRVEGQLARIIHNYFE